MQAAHIMNPMQQEVLTKQAHSLLALYNDDLRPTLEEQDADALTAVDMAARALKEALSRDPVLSIGFLGASQVGKSSIINAFLDERTLPSGGIGPLTAQATRVVYRDANAFEARYHDRQRFNQLLFALREYLRRRGELPESAAALEPSETAEESDEPFFVDGPVADDPDAEAQNKYASTSCEHMLSSVRLMLTQEGVPKPDGLSRLALVDALRLILGQKPYGDAAELSPWSAAIANIRDRLSESENYNEDDADRRAFKKELRVRAAGWLSPLVASLNVHLRKPALHGLAVIDLPGVSNFADAGGSVAREFVEATNPGALVVVLRNNLLDEGVHTLLMGVLEHYGIVGNLLWGAAKEAIPLSLIFLVTNVDNVALDRWSALRLEAEENDDPPPSPDSVFTDVAGHVETRLRAQFREALDQRLQGERTEGSDDKQAERVAQAVEALGARTHVLCVSAPDYLHIQERSGMEFVKNREATNIPRLREILRGLAEERRVRQGQEIAEAYEEFHEALTRQVASLERVYEEGGGPATAGFGRFHDALDATRQELSVTLAGNRKAAGKALDEGVHQHIRQLLELASAAGHKRLKRLRVKADAMYWSSLNAALARNGAWTTGGGRSIDYPADLANAISEQIAGGWDDIVIGSVKTTTRALIQSELELVEQLCARAVELDAQFVKQEHVDEQRALLRAAMNTTVRWTRDRLVELTTEVEAKLRDEIAPPIEKACEKARKAGKNRGSGAKQRIVDAFETGGADAVDAAVRGADAVLQRQCQVVLKEIRSSHLRDTFDPLQRAFDKLTNAEQERAGRLDAKRRQRVLASLNAHHDALRSLAPAASLEAGA